ncbi:MAG: glycoside hydrolase, partial [Dysgonamonadaceae bacterium]|nr:glycoside hydrolase [Dysgonamonadaceae bacterium]
VATEKEAQKALKNLSVAQNVCQPGTPYLYHYYIQSLINSGLPAEAKKALTDYWGGMIKKGADTFWEAYDPTNDFLSPYNFYPINSYCHAWSCTPTYFIRKYPEIFQ